jgi:hypothetical protein
MKDASPADLMVYLGHATQALSLAEGAEAKKEIGHEFLSALPLQARYGETDPRFPHTYKLVRARIIKAMTPTPRRKPASGKGRTQTTTGSKAK